MCVHTRNNTWFSLFIKGEPQDVSAMQPSGSRCPVIINNQILNNLYYFPVGYALEELNQLIHTPQYNSKVWCFASCAIKTNCDEYVTNWHQKYMRWKEHMFGTRRSRKVV